MGKHQERRCCLVLCATLQAHPGKVAQSLIVGCQNREDMFLASSVEPQEGYKASEKKWVHNRSPWRDLRSLAKLSMPQWVLEAYLLCSRGHWRNGGCSWTWKGHANRMKDGSINTSVEGCPWGPDSSLPPLLRLLHTLASHNHLPETRHNSWERGGWNQQVLWDWVSDNAKKKWKLEIKMKLYFFI